MPAVEFLLLLKEKSFFVFIFDDDAIAVFYFSEYTVSKTTTLRNVD